MKFVYVCRGCGSADITEKCTKLINKEEIIVCYYTYVCNNCGCSRPNMLADVDAPDDLDVQTDKWNFAEERWESK